MSHTTFAEATHTALEAMEPQDKSCIALEIMVPPGKAEKESGAKPVDPGLVSRLRALIETGYKGKLWSRNELARAIGTNSANVSMYIRQDAPNAPDLKFSVKTFEAKVRDFLSTLASKREFNRGIIATAIVTRFAGFVDNVRATNEIGFYYGEAGMGKTTAMESYAAGRPNVLALTATKWSAGAHGMEVQLAAAMHLQSHQRGVARAELVTGKLKEMESAVILVDNAHRLTHGAVEFLFDLYDVTGTPLVFVGNRRFMDKLRTDDQLFSRLFFRTQAVFPEVEGKPRYAQLHAAADALLKRELPDHYEELRTMARKVAREAGHLRALVKRCRSAAEIAQHPAFSSRPMTDAFLAAHAASVHTGYSLEDE